MQAPHSLAANRIHHHHVSAEAHEPISVRGDPDLVSRWKFDSIYQLIVQPLDGTILSKSKAHNSGPCLLNLFGKLPLG